jgi:hypothetical protein
VSFVASPVKSFDFGGATFEGDPGIRGQTQEPATPVPHFVRVDVRLTAEVGLLGDGRIAVLATFTPIDTRYLPDNAEVPYGFSVGIASATRPNAPLTWTTLPGGATMTAGHFTSVMGAGAVSLLAGEYVAAVRGNIGVAVDKVPLFPFTHQITLPVTLAAKAH